MLDKSDFRAGTDISDTGAKCSSHWISDLRDAQSVMLSSLFTAVIICRYAFCKSDDAPYWLIRTKRSVWMASQILYVILSTCLYTVFLCLTELLIASPWAYVGNVWSQTVAKALDMEVIIILRSCINKDNGNDNTI